MNSILGKHKLRNVLEMARRASKAAGDAAELGVYRGGVLCELAAIFRPPRTIWGYDSFDGLPSADWREGEIHAAGDFADTSFEIVARQCAAHSNIRLVKGHIPESLVDARFAFVHLDLDFYASTRNALAWLLPRMNDGGAIVLDDFDWPRCPGVRRAVDELGLCYRKLSDYQACIEQ